MSIRVEQNETRESNLLSIYRDMSAANAGVAKSSLFIPVVGKSVNWKAVFSRYVMHISFLSINAAGSVASQPFRTITDSY